MRKIFFIVALIVAFNPTFAQEEKTAKDFKKEAQDAYKAKDYKTAYDAYFKAIALNKKNNEVDTALFYNTGYCAYKSKQYTEAAKLMTRAIDLNYKKKEKAYQFAAISYKKAGDEDNLDKALDAGIAEFPNNKKLKKIKAGVVFKKGLMHYNTASTHIQTAATLVESDPEKYKVEKANAEKYYKMAMPLLEEAYDLNPKTKNLKEALIGVYEGLGMKEKAEKMKAATVE